ncbi:MAG: Amidase [Dehalococcoidales bacterium]|nr:Amidase [Dehalococcoidales bacterium]
MERMKEQYNLTVREAALAIREGKLSSLQLVQSCLERIDAVEEKIQAWALVDREGALAAATRLDRELSQGQRRGWLHGIPLGVKDIFYTAGLRTEAGSASWSGFVPSYDAATITRLKEAGAIILGKTRTTEFAYLDPAPTRNPWNTAHTPGGSSSGSGAAVAAGMCLAALGSQTLGSTLRPAAYNGIVGFKAQNSRISTYGVVPFSWTLDHIGILARNVEDTAIVFQNLAGYDARDLCSLAEPIPDCTGNLENQKAPRLGLLRSFFFDHADEEMRHHTEVAVARLQQAGAKVEEVPLPDNFSKANDIAIIIMAVEAAVYHQEMFASHKDQYGPAIRKLIEKGLSTPATEYGRALRARLQLRADIEPLLGGIDALVTPGTTGAAPLGLASTGSPVMQGPWSVTGLPAISLPIGLGQAGLPLAIQLVGPPRDECALLAVARWCERVLDVHLRPALN